METGTGGFVTLVFASFSFLRNVRLATALARSKTLAVRFRSAIAIAFIATVVRTATGSGALIIEMSSALAFRSASLLRAAEYTARLPIESLAIGLRRRVGSKRIVNTDKQGCTRIRSDVRRLVREPNPSRAQGLGHPRLISVHPCLSVLNSYRCHGQTRTIEEGTGGLYFSVLERSQTRGPRCRSGSWRLGSHQPT